MISKLRTWLADQWGSLVGGPPPRRRLVVEADRLRDRRVWPEAADAYRRVLAYYPGLAPILVQLGHALKESGDVAGAEAAYRQALVAKPRSADTYVQLGHVLKLQDRRDEAIAAYASAVQVNSRFTPALRELVALGAGATAWTSGQADLHDLMRMTSDMRAMLARVERLLPDIVSLASVAIGQYGLFRKLYRLPLAPAVSSSRQWAVLIVACDGEIEAPLASVVRQTGQPAIVFVAGASPAALARAAQADHYGLICPVHPWPDAALTPATIDWLLVISGGAKLASSALEWLDWAAENSTAAAIYPDEDWVSAETGDSVPNFKAGFDRYADRALYDHAVVALRAGVIVPGSSLEVSDLLAGAAERGYVAHLACVLASRPGTPPVPTAPSPIRIAPGGPGRITVIVPTCDGVATLRPCINSLRRLAVRPDEIEFVVVDHQSRSADTCAYLAELEQAGAATVLRVDGAFNWSRFNNAAVATSRSELLLFINDDVEFATAGWDDILRTVLQEPGIGVVGARLNYPDGGLQHAGIIFGPNRRCDHEGVGVARVPAQIAQRWAVRRQVGAVTGAFLACQRQVYADMNGFDTTLPIWFGDVDFCMRVRAVGAAVLYEPRLVGVHHESRTLARNASDPARSRIWDQSLADMQRRWGAALVTDPWFNPHFARQGRPFEAIIAPSLEQIRLHLVGGIRPAAPPEGRRTDPRY
ncbi:MAG: glycosyltransferase [Acetobacteraceae bacterium]|nr:glycosyltransferase [Acetobacteraceae bacterium]